MGWVGAPANRVDLSLEVGWCLCGQDLGESGKEWHIRVLYFQCYAQIINFLSCPSPRPVGDIGFANSQLMSIGLQKPYAKTKIGKSCTCMMFIDLADDCC
jgi:hypothetical protein